MFPVKHYLVSTDIFEGPLDILLQLIEKAELDITKLALAQVTDQFIDHLHQMPQNMASDVSSFLIIASRLLQIKSEALLPRPPLHEPDEIDPGEALARQLIIYKRYKEIAQLIGNLHSLQHTFPRWAPTPHIEPSVDLNGISVRELLQAAQDLLFKEDQISLLSSVVANPRISIRERIGWIVEFINLNKLGAFSQLVSGASHRLEIVVTFLALLELVKRDMILVKQEDIFGEIVLEPAPNWDDDLAFELEFGE